MRAERVRFELTVQLAATQLISSQLPSATRAPLRVLIQFAGILMESFRLFIGEHLEPSFAEKAGAKRVGRQHAADAPEEGDDEPPEDVCPKCGGWLTKRGWCIVCRRRWVGFQNEGSAPGEDGDEPSIDGPVGSGVPPLESGSASTPRGGDRRQSLAGADSPPCPSLDDALAQKVRAITSRTSEVVE